MSDMLLGVKLACATYSITQEGDRWLAQGEDRFGFESDFLDDVVHAIEGDVEKRLKGRAPSSFRIADKLSVTTRDPYRVFDVFTSDALGEWGAIDSNGVVFEADDLSDLISLIKGWQRNNSVRRESEDEATDGDGAR